MIDASTKLVGLLGWPLEHSFSPLMQNAAFNALALNWCYLPFPVPPDRFEQALKGLMALGVRGLNVTIPYKQMVIPHLASLEETASQLGAVNTIGADNPSASESHYQGYNTDVPGFINALKFGGFDEFDGRHAVVVGAGGAARAVIYGLIKEGISKITVLTRNQKQGQVILDDFSRLSKNIRLSSFTPEHLIAALSEAELLVNATPVGTWPNVDCSIWPEGISLPPQITIFDLVYNPSVTRLKKQARRSQVAFIDGLEMLIQQGALSFQIWTGIPAPVEVMRKTCQKIIGD